jgi:hypothetical protein
MSEGQFLAVRQSIVAIPLSILKITECAMLFCNVGGDRHPPFSSKKSTSHTQAKVQKVDQHDCQNGLA